MALFSLDRMAAGGMQVSLLPCCMLPCCPDGISPLLLSTLPAALCLPGLPCSPSSCCLLGLVEQPDNKHQRHGCASPWIAGTTTWAGDLRATLWTNSGTCPTLKRPVGRGRMRDLGWDLQQGHRATGRWL